LQPEIVQNIELVYTKSQPQRLDKFLISSEVAELHSRSYIEKLIAGNLIRVNAKDVKKSYLLQEGDTIGIDIPQKEPAAVIPQDIPLEIIYEDEYLVVIDKQAGITVHPAVGNPAGTLVNALMHHLQGNLSQGSDVLRPGIVHRLDKDTSGLLIVAKDDRTHALLSKMFQEKAVKKTYLAITVGVPKTPEGIIETFIDRSRTDRKKMAVSPTGKTAITHYRVWQDYHYFSVLQIGLETGRTHQIRVHFSHLNCPILGDTTYSGLKQTLSMLPMQYHKKVKFLLANHLQRQALHAWKLQFAHPVTGQELLFEAPLPTDIQYALDWLERNFNE